MTSELTEEARQLGRDAFQLGINHLTDWFEQVELAYDRVDAIHEDVYGTKPDWSPPISRETQERLVALRKIAIDSHETSQPALATRRQATRHEHCAAEDRLGALLALDAPQFILDVIGPAPKASGTTSSLLKDDRWWAQGHPLGSEMTPRRYWERIAGAYASLVASECDGDPTQLHSAWDRASASQSSAHSRAINDAFTDITVMASAAADLLNQAMTNQRDL